jgi:hypothetical protein
MTTTPARCARCPVGEAGPELPGVSEFFPDESAVVLTCGRLAAAELAQRAWTLRESLPGTWAARAAGELDQYRARILVEVLQHTHPVLPRRVEARLLPGAARLTARPTARKLPKRAVELLLLELDPDAWNRRREQAERRADVRVEPSRRRAWPGWSPTCPPTSPRPATPRSARRRGCSRPTATPAPSGCCAPRWSPTWCCGPGRRRAR